MLTLRKPGCKRTVPQVLSQAAELASAVTLRCLHRVLSHCGSGGLPQPCTGRAFSTAGLPCGHVSPPCIWRAPLAEKAATQNWGNRRRPPAPASCVHVSAHGTRRQACS